MPNLGTRTKSSVQYGQPAQGRDTRSFTRDLGMTKRVTAAMTFDSATARVTAANGTFAAFAARDPLWVEDGATRNGGSFFTIVAIDAVNAAFLALDPAPNDETTTATVRTP